ncbi:MAG: UDP-N-acetylmuramate--L-alanine ligase [Elusimicrobia bacterium RIFOXYA2_FULL_50_26]|nr:MAG: UDP-N-acetylmuramate--L-alanine ligase [Elusimicrobia bacterium RIFOXYA2_FULL_50_26]OGS23114.1 MAG: UDP-N-acetylmuramate--L-alanine ligase [Elusimicrobia bacterium RIFOXYB2_FULL_50_12]
MFKKIQNIHFVGIGGVGMSGIAEVLLSLGYKVSGSDIKASDFTEHLKALGARVFIGHAAKNLGTANVVVTSTAVDSANPEVVSARRRKIPVIPRVEMLAELARLKYSITIAGTHGKTTTTSMASLVLSYGRLDPTVVIGGRLKNISSGAKLGNGDYLVAEADESDGSFLKLSPTITVVTNIDNDHLDYYGTIENIKEAFKEHINSVPFYGCAILCADDANVVSLLPSIKRRYVTYGIMPGADFTATGIKVLDSATRFTVRFRGRPLGTIMLKTPGMHAVSNALAAVVVGVELGIAFRDIARALDAFAGVGRRMEIKGEKKGVLVIDDYGHHPTEVKATLAAVKMKWPRRKLVVLFQPHRYSRTSHLHHEFGGAFGDADELYILPIYAAGEKPVAGVSAQLIVEAVRESGENAGHFPGTEILSRSLKSGDIVLTLGAGDVWKTGEEILKLL